MENKKNVNIWKTLQKVPAGTMFVPLIIGAIITTFVRAFSSLIYGVPWVTP